MDTCKPYFLHAAAIRLNLKPPRRVGGTDLEETPEGRRWFSLGGKQADQLPDSASTPELGPWKLREWGSPKKRVNLPQHKGSWPLEESPPSALGTASSWEVPSWIKLGGGLGLPNGSMDAGGVYFGEKASATYSPQTQGEEVISASSFRVTLPPSTPPHTPPTACNWPSSSLGENNKVPKRRSTPGSQGGIDLSIPSTCVACADPGTYISF